MAKFPVKLATVIAVMAILFLSIPACEKQNTEGDPTEITIVEIYSGDGQTERVGVALPDALVVRVTDLLGDPKGDMQVEFATSDPGAIVEPATRMTDVNGFASVTFTLGDNTGTQHVTATADEVSETFDFTAAGIECDEEDPSMVCTWERGHIFITTTSSSYLSGSGSVLIEFDPSDGSTEKVLETSEWIVDLAFSPRGELFLTSSNRLFKVNPVTKALETYLSYSSSSATEIEPDFGSVLVAARSSVLFGIFCPSTSLFAQNFVSNQNSECLAVCPRSRDVYTVTGTSISFRIHRTEWDGRSDFGETTEHYLMNVGTAYPHGMCIDGEGTLFITLDGVGSNPDRSIARLDSDLTWNEKLFDFHDYYGDNTAAGRWGDITLFDGNLYLIDKRNDRLVVISTEGTYVDEYESDVFSLPGTESERYGIEAHVPLYMCTTAEAE